jgi:hypothetical protein
VFSFCHETGSRLVLLHGGRDGLWFLRTHPLNDVRIKQLKQWLPDVQREYRPQN